MEYDYSTHKKTKGNLKISFIYHLIEMIHLTQKEKAKGDNKE